MTIPIDRDLLHEYMWNNCDAKTHKLNKTQVLLAEELDVTTATMSHIFKELMAAGRVRKRGLSFYVTDPAVWRWKNPA